MACITLQKNNNNLSLPFLAPTPLSEPSSICPLLLPLPFSISPFFSPFPYLGMSILLAFIIRFASSSWVETDDDRSEKMGILRDWKEQKILDWMVFYCTASLSVMAGVRQTPLDVSRTTTLVAFYLSPGTPSIKCYTWSRKKMKEIILVLTYHTYNVKDHFAR